MVQEYVIDDGKRKTPLVISSPDLISALWATPSIHGVLFMFHKDQSTEEIDDSGIRRLGVQGEGHFLESTSQFGCGSLSIRLPGRVCCSGSVPRAPDVL